MALHKILVANRGEIAIRIIRGAAELGLGTVAVYSTDDAESLHTRNADEAHDLGAEGAQAYLDMERMLEIAKASGCDAIHPGRERRVCQALCRRGRPLRGPSPGDAGALR
jgi:acetyl/propionyl-CoA carboxylase alpha subunit